MSESNWTPLRTNAHRVTVYNEGLIVYLWDEAHRADLESSGADFESGYAETDAGIDAELKQLANRDLLIAYELLQDEAVSVDVLVGPPLTKKELSSSHWSKPQLARLKLSSGNLRIDTADTLPMNSSVADEPAGIVQLPPGDYVLHLYRIDWDKMSADGLVTDDQPWTGPQEILVLTPAADVKPVKKNKPLLRYGALPSWHGKYKIVDGAFFGQALASTARGAFQLNMDAAAVAALSVEVGSLLTIELEGLTIEAVFVGKRDVMQLHKHQSYHLAGGRPEFGYAYQLIWDSDSERVLTIDRSVTVADFPSIGKRTPVRVTLQAERLAVPK